MPTAVRPAGVSLKLIKCHFFTDRVKYIGHIIRRWTLGVEKAATRSLKGLRQPETPGEFRSLLGMCNVYRRFIARYSHIAASSYTFLIGKVPKEISELTPEQIRGYRAIIRAATEPLFLALRGRACNNPWTKTPVPIK